MKAGFRFPLRSRFVLQWQGFGSFAWSIDWWTPRGSIRTSHLGMQPLSRKKHRGKPESFKFKFSKVTSSSVTRNDFHTSKVCSRDHDQRKHKWTHNKLLIFNVITDNTFYKSSILLMLFKNTRVEIQMLHLETECISQICWYVWFVTVSTWKQLQNYTCSS